MVNGINEDNPVQNSRITGGSIENLVKKDSVERVGFASIDFYRPYGTGLENEIGKGVNRSQTKIKIAYEGGGFSEYKGHFEWHPLLLRPINILNGIFSEKGLYLTQVSFGNLESDSPFIATWYGDVYRDRK